MFTKHYIVRSSAVASIVWVANCAFVEFKTGNVYLIKGISHELILDWIHAESKGQFYTQYVKGHFPSELVQRASSEIRWNKEIEFDPIELDDIDCAMM